MSAIGFDLKWIEMRGRWDARARCRDLENNLLEHLGSVDRPIRILDIGAGTCSNWFHWHRRLGPKQHWTFIEIDPKLLNHGRKELEQAMEWVQMGKEIMDDTLDFEFEWYAESIFSWIEKHTSVSFDFCLSNGLFDLLTENQMEQILDFLTMRETPLLATMLYSNMFFKPQVQRDLEYISHYEDHMQREQELGRAMGKNVSDFLIDQLKARRFQVYEKPSTWKLIDPSGIHMILEFMARSVPDMIEPGDYFYFQEWLEQKDRMLKDLELVVNHSDILALPMSL